MISRIQTRSDRRFPRLAARLVLAAIGLYLVASSAAWAEDRPAQPTTGVAIDAGSAATSAPAPENATIPTKDLMDIVRGGGPLMIPLGVCSLLLVAFVFERTIALRHRRIIPKPFVQRILDQIGSGDLNREQALELCEQNGSPVSEVFAAAIRKWGRPAVEVEQAIIDSGERVTNGLRRYLRVLNGITTISPLIGLLGTVLGMIAAFNAIATSSALGRPELLASGISEALLTTAAGLSVAIPALFFHLFFVSRVDRLIIDIDALGQQLVNLISAEELSNRGGKAPAPAFSRRSKREAAEASD